MTPAAKGPFSVDKKYTYLDTQAHYQPRDGWEGTNQSDKATQNKTMRAKTAQQRQDYACLGRSSTGQQQISKLMQIIDNLIYLDL